MKKLGFILDCHLTMNAQVSNVARTCYFELRRLASIRIFLTSIATATLVSAFVLSRIVYFNSLLSGSTHGVTSHPMLHRKPSHTRNTRSSAYTMPLLNREAHSKATLGDRSFSFAFSSVWNSITNAVRFAPSLSSYMSRLKTYILLSLH